jgi:hypothetical protein
MFKIYANDFRTVYKPYDCNAQGARSGFLTEDGEICMEMRAAAKFETIEAAHEAAEAAGITINTSVQLGQFTGYAIKAY